MVVTIADIHPDGGWDFIYGIASANDRIDLFSFARSDPLFLNIDSDEPITEIDEMLLLKRAVAVFIHKAIHLFGADHCVYYLCMMNGTGTSEELDGQPLYLCPICLRKMYVALGSNNRIFNVIRMYTQILQVCDEFHFKDESEWYRNRLKILHGI